MPRVSMSRSLVLSIKQTGASTFVAACDALPVSASGETAREAIERALVEIRTQMLLWLRESAAARMRLIVTSWTEYRVELLLTC